jgi:hypothetical protein
VVIDRLDDPIVMVGAFLAQRVLRWPLSYFKLTMFDEVDPISSVRTLVVNILTSVEVSRSTIQAYSFNSVVAKPLEDSEFFKE